MGLLAEVQLMCLHCLNFLALNSSFSAQFGRMVILSNYISDLYLLHLW